MQEKSLNHHLNHLFLSFFISIFNLISDHYAFITIQPLMYLYSLLFSFFHLQHLLFVPIIILFLLLLYTFPLLNFFRLIFQIFDFQLCYQNLFLKFSIFHLYSILIYFKQNVAQIIIFKLIFYTFLILLFHFKV